MAKKVENKESYKVGRGKPPLEPRFKPGESGNPNGRPKGQRNFTTIYRAALEDLARQKKISPDELENILVKVGIAKAIAGDHRFYADTFDRIHGKAAQPLTGANGKDLIPTADAKADADAALDAFLNGGAKR